MTTEPNFSQEKIKHRYYYSTITWLKRAIGPIELDLRTLTCRCYLGNQIVQL